VLACVAMGMYLGVRGWIELQYDQRAAAEQIIERHDDGFYSGGWTFPRAAFNWTLYLFYGGDIRESGLPWLRTQVDELAALPPDEDGDRPRGLFVASDERGGVETWQIRNGAVHVHPAPEYTWLNE
jgi:hypothetical protein